MRIIFFGSSHGLPEPDRKCSSIMIKSGDSCYFIDMGTPPLDQLAERGISVESVKSVFITHMHGDHTNGLIPFIDLCNGYYTKANPEFYLPGNTEKTVSAIKEWIKCQGCTWFRDFKFNHVDDGFVYRDEKIKLSAFRTGHTDESFSYLLEAEGKRVFFSGDLKIQESDTEEKPDLPAEEFDKGLDLAILELAHFNAVDKYYKFLKDRTNINTVCINHYSSFKIASYISLCELLPKQKFVLATDRLEFEL